MARLIALLRGINVGGRKKVPMARLRELLADLGYTDVRTYVNSGNAVFTAPESEGAAEVEGKIEQALAAEFGFAVSVLVRSRDELADVVDANPLGAVATDPSRYVVAFLDRDAAPVAVAGLDPADFEPEAFQLRGREVYMWAPEGIAQAAIVRELSEKRLGATATARNWRTVEKLLAMADE